MLTAMLAIVVVLCIVGWFMIGPDDDAHRDARRRNGRD